jgi:hypothetical protein
MQRSILAGILCVLAFLFAFEAKLLWYSPASDTSSQVSAAKALPVDAPRLISHGAPAPNRIPTQVAISMLAFVLAAWISTSAIPARRFHPGGDPTVFFPAYFSSPIDVRPPPAR